MAAQTQVRVVIDAKDNASRVLGSLGKQFGALGKSADNLGADFKNIGKIAIAGAAGLLAFATKAAFSAARVEELGFALNAIAKANDISQEAVDGTVASLRDMNIAHAKALQVTSLFIQSQLDLADATKVANAAKDLAVVAGMDSSEATETLTNAIIMQRPMLLKQFGIVSGLDQIYQRFAESTGATASELTDLQKRQAFLNEILRAGEKVAGTYDAAMGSVSKQFRSLTGRIIPDFMAKIGKAFSPALTKIIDAITESIKGMEAWMDQNADQIEVWGEKLGQAMAKGIEVFKALVDFVMNNKEILVGIFAALAVGVGALAVAFITAHAVTIAVIGAIIAIGTLLAKAWQVLPPVFIEIWEQIKTAFESAKNFILEKWEDIKLAIEEAKEFIGEKLDELNAFYKSHEIVIQGIAGIITAFFLPALIKIGVEALIAGTKIAVGLIARIIQVGVQAIITNTILVTKFIVNIIKLGIQSAVTGGIMAVKLIAGIIKLGVQAFIASTVGLAKIIASTIAWGLEGWKVIGMLLVKIAKLGLATAAILIQKGATIALTLATAGWTAATWLLNAALLVLTSPIALVVLAILALIAIGVLLIKNWDKIKEAAVKKFDEIKEKIEKVINFIRDLIEKFKPRIKIGLDLPDIGAAWEGLKQKARDIGVPGFQTGGIVSGPIGTPTLATVHGGERIIPAGVAPATVAAGGGLTINAYIGLYAGSETEKRNIASELYSALARLARSQNKTISELIGA